MSRTTQVAVQRITQVDDTIDLSPFIEAANALVTEICAPVVTYDATRLELIERWLAAHFARVYDARIYSEKVDVLFTSITGKTDLGLDLTYEGQQAKLLDTSGGLAKLNFQMTGKGKVKAQFLWVGTKPPPWWKEWCR